MRVPIKTMYALKDRLFVKFQQYVAVRIKFVLCSDLRMIIYYFTLRFPAACLHFIDYLWIFCTLDWTFVPLFFLNFCVSVRSDHKRIAGLFYTITSFSRHYRIKPSKKSNEIEFCSRNERSRNCINASCRPTSAQQVHVSHEYEVLTITFRTDTSQRTRKNTLIETTLEKCWWKMAIKFFAFISC